MESLPGDDYERKRIDKLKDFQILDTEAERDFDEIVQLASLVCESSISLVSLVDSDRQWFKARTGFTLTQTTREIAFCDHAIRQDDILIVNDTHQDKRFERNPLVTESPNVRFYAGMPLITSDGYKLGTLCVLDSKPKTLSDKQIFAMRILAKQVMQQLELRQSVKIVEEQKKSLIRTNQDLYALNQDLQASEEEIRMHLDRIQLLQYNLEIRERQFRGMVENATDLIYELDENGIFTFVNPVMESVSGYTREQFTTRIYYDLVHPMHRQRVIDFYKHQRKNCIENTYLEFMMVTASGKVIWIGQNVRMFFDANAHVYRVGSISRDITDLKRTEQMLENSEKRFRLLSENSPVGIFQTDQDGKCTYVNRRWCEMTGLTDDEARGDGWTTAIHDADRKLIISSWKDTVAISGEFVKDLRLVDKNGKTRWVTSRAIQITSEHGQLTGFIGTLHDITELKEVHHKLQEREKLYRLLSDNSSDIITLFKGDSDPTRVFISSSAKDILGYEPEELIGKSPFDIMVPEDIPHAREITSSIIMNGMPATLEYRVKRKDGVIIWIESKSHPYFDDYGNMTGFQTSAREVTRRKEFEQSLQEAKQKAEEATLSKSKFLSMMSHEIRTPMNAIIGLTNLLIQGNPTPDQTEKLSLLKFSGENLLTIINDILDFSKIEAGRITLEYVDVDLFTLVSNTRKMLDHKVVEKNLDLRLSYDNRIPDVVKVDPVRLTQIITNLAGNAVKFTEAGCVEIHVEWKGEKAGRHTIYFSISDTGIGIHADKIYTIFEGFSQADTDTTRRFGGTGLGLSITKSLVQLMGGEIHVESTLGEGSVFSFSLTVEGGRAHAPIIEMPVARVADGDGRFIRVLLVEDNLINQIVATNFIRGWAMEVDVANNGKEAVDMVHDKRYDLVLMDIQMPVMDGYEAARRIRGMSDVRYKEVPIIALTASAMFGMRDKVLEAGMNDFISKPFVPADLEAVIRKYVLNRGTDLPKAV